MAPTTCQATKPKVGEEVLDLVIPYVHNLQDRNSLSLVSHKLYEIDGITRKRVTVHILYSNPSLLSKRFPFIESLTLKGPPSCFIIKDGRVIRITSWIEQIALEFRCLKELHICGLVVTDEDLETLARTHGNDLRSLRISKSKGFSTYGLMHVSKYCNQLKTLCLKYCGHMELKDKTWLHELAFNSTALETLHVTDTTFCDAEYFTLLAKNCCNSLISLKIRLCYLSKLGDAFRYAVRLEHFGVGYICDEESELVGFKFPPNICSLSIGDLPVNRYSIVLPFLNHIRKLKLYDIDEKKCQCSLFKRCPNLEVLYTKDVCGDTGLQVIGQFCKKLRKLTHKGVVTHVGLIALAKGCTNLETLKVGLGDVSNEALEYVGTHLKNLRVFSISLCKKDGITHLPLDNGVCAMLLCCSKLERLGILLRHGGLTDVGLEYIGKYGANLRSLYLTLVGNSNAGLVKLSKGCPRLRKLKLWGCLFNKHVAANSLFNIPTVRYVRFYSSVPGRIGLTLTRPEFQL